MQEQNVPYQERDMLQQPFTREELEALIGDRPAALFLNDRHPRYKESGWAENPPPRDEAISLMLEDPNLIQRPLLRRGDRFVFGPDADGWAALTGVSRSG